MIWYFPVTLMLAFAMRGPAVLVPYEAMVTGAALVPIHAATKLVPDQVQPRLKSKLSPAVSGALFALATVFHAVAGDDPEALSWPAAQST
jgi:hypothetical protein